MELPEQSKIDAVWQRVRGNRPMPFCALSQREQSILELSRRLYDLGVCRPLMKKLYAQAKQRNILLGKMASIADEEVCGPAAGNRRAAPGELVQLLGQTAAEYDPGHPIYGGLFAQFRQECVWGQKMLLTLL